MMSGTPTQMNLDGENGELYQFYVTPIIVGGKVYLRIEWFDRCTGKRIKEVLFNVQEERC